MIIYISSSCGPTYASIYRCDMDGSNNVLITDDALNGSECYIADDMLYYTSFCSWKPCLRFNISCVNLNDFSHKTVIKDTWQIELWDGKYIFFGKESGGDYYRCDKDGKNICKMSEDDVEIFADLIYGGYGYKLYDGAIYKYDWSGNSKWISNTVRRVGDAILFDRGNNVENIIDGKVYYTMDVEWSAYYFRQNSVIYRCNMDGTNHEIVAAMFIP